MKKKEQKKEKQFKKVWEKLWQNVIGRLPEVDIKRLFLTNLPYVLVFYVVNKLAWLYQYCQGNSLLERLSVLTLNVSLAFENILPSLRFSDIGVGFTGVVLLKGIVYVKGKNAKKFRQGVEYGSARWGTAKDIAPFMDSVFENNIILTQTERLTMNSRPKKPKYARNKNVMIIGGSGSGKTRFYVKPNLMQMTPNVSYVVTDPKGLIYKVQRNKRCFINRSCEETLICLYLQAFSQKGGGKHGTAK